MSNSEPEFIRSGGNPFQSAQRTAEFWRRATGIYVGYKIAQGRAKLMRLRGHTKEDIKDQLWTPHHSWAGDEMYSLAVDLRGFYLKVFQFIGARGDFVPEPICRKLSRLHDEVPPMPARQVKDILKRELGVAHLRDVFEWIDLENPLGSASLSQVHKAKLVRPGSATCRALSRVQKRCQDGSAVIHKVQPGETLFQIAKAHALAIREIREDNPGLDLDRMQPGLLISIPVKPTAGSASTPQDVQRTLAACSATPSSAKQSPDGIVAVKVQYPDASKEMSMDLGNIRSFAHFLSKTELQFDLVSAVDELADQIRLEFFFKREARVMNEIAGNLKNIRRRVAVPTSVEGLVTDRVLVMNYLDGVQITKLASKMDNLSPRARKMAARRVLTRVSEAYGRMLLLEGLFQADGHPGNILVLSGGRVGLLDYGQSKQLEDHHRKAFAELILELHRKKEHRISDAVAKLGIVTEGDNAAMRAKMAREMFDTTGRVDPFAENSPIKSSAIKTFPKDLFFVLRTTQLLRGLANGMDIDDFSCVEQWVPYAKTALRQLKGVPSVIPV